MISHQQMQLALRTRASSLSVCTTGSTTLQATSTGYARSSGSFLTDGFRPGMEVVGTGFNLAANNAAKTVTAVTATALTCSGTSLEGAASGRTLSVGLPSRVAWEGIVFEPSPGDPWGEEQFVPGPSRQVTLSTYGEMEFTALYVMRVNVPEGVGTEAANAYADALIEHFAPNVTLTLDNGDVVRVRTDTSPFRGQLLARKPGWLVVPVTIPTLVRTPLPN